MHLIPEKPLVGNENRGAAAWSQPDLNDPNPPSPVTARDRIAGRLSERFGIPFVICAAHCDAAGLGRAL